MTDVLLIVFVIAAVVIAGFALEKHSKKTRQELMDELADEEPTPAPTPEVKQMVESQEEHSIPKPAKKRRRGRPAAKKD
jgi:sensor histidine kinase regulating citrate/malate metabolism